jgi:uncharacterized membrane protein YgdD (TMEM256/DUF423 family)
MHRFLYRTAAIFAGLSVVIGAFGAHFLKTILSPESLSSIQTAVNYQMIHSLAIIVVGLLYSHYRVNRIILVGYFLIAGIILFSGSIYILALLKYLGFEHNVLVGLLTPLGGLSFIIGWVVLLLSIPVERNNSKGSKQGSE